MGRFTISTSTTKQEQGITNKITIEHHNICTLLASPHPTAAPQLARGRVVRSSAVGAFASSSTDGAFPCMMDIILKPPALPLPRRQSGASRFYRSRMVSRGGIVEVRFGNRGDHIGPFRVVFSQLSCFGSFILHVVLFVFKVGFSSHTKSSRRFIFLFPLKTSVGRRGPNRYTKITYTPRRVNEHHTPLTNSYDKWGPHSPALSSTLIVPQVTVTSALVEACNR